MPNSASLALTPHSLSWLARTYTGAAVSEEGELANPVKAHLPQIAHVQLADNPGRNEPGTGEINYRFLFGFLDAIGHDGWIGCEYKPKGNTVDGLGWRAAHGV